MGWDDVKLYAFAYMPLLKVEVGVAEPKMQGWVCRCITSLVRTFVSGIGIG